MIALNWQEAVTSDKPFVHARLATAVPLDAADAALAWLTTEAPWTLRVEDFYVQHEFSLRQVPLGEGIAPFASDVFVEQVRVGLRRALTVDKDLRLVDVNAHRLTPGQVIRIHNDFIEGAETHRMLIQLNHGWSAANGGLLMLFGDDEVNSVKDIILPRHASGFAFEISPRSFHAVSEIHAGERYTLVYTFA
jgi:Rps23 Pro-64 3,4-dihydroxylase Tpa1-like proline 4-hydroxylase